MNFFWRKSRFIRQFERQAPNAVYLGNDSRGKMWVETIVDEVHSIPIKLAYVTVDEGETAEAYCIEPDMRNHDLDSSKCHCYSDGKLCTDQYLVTRTLAEKRARSILWVTGFVEFLRTGKFPF